MFKMIANGTSDLIHYEVHLCNQSNRRHARNEEAILLAIVVWSRCHLHIRKRRAEWF